MRLVDVPASSLALSMETRDACLSASWISTFYRTPVSFLWPHSLLTHIRRVPVNPSALILATGLDVAGKP